MPDKVVTTARVPGVSGALQDQIVDGLNCNLATLTDLALAYKQAHWNVLGQDFTQLHELFDQFAAEVRGYMDLVAERATTLGGAAHGTIQNVVERSALPPFPPDERDETQLLDELVRRVDGVVAVIRQAIAECEEELATQDLYIEIVRGVEKQRWMLLAHLTRHGQDSGRDGRSA